MHRQSKGASLRASLVGNLVSTGEVRAYFYGVRPVMLKRDYLLAREPFLPHSLIYWMMDEKHKAHRKIDIWIIFGFFAASSRLSHGKTLSQTELFLWSNFPKASLVCESSWVVVVVGFKLSLSAE